MSLRDLALEIKNDPLARGYAGMTDPDVAIDLNTAYRTIPLRTVSAAEIFENLDRTEFAALNTQNVARVDRILGLGGDILVQGQARQELLAVFGGGSTTITNLQAYINPPASRAEELGLGRVRHGDVTDARHLITTGEV